MENNRPKVLLVNGSPHQFGCTYTALNEVKSALNNNGVDADFFWIGNKPIAGCIACKSCVDSHRCVQDDVVNDFLDIIDGYDGFVFGSPVYFASATGAMTAFLDRVFYSGIYRSNRLLGRPAACVVSCRRAGSSAALDQLNKYITISGMLLVSAKYWNMVHGNTPEQVLSDVEGINNLHILGNNLSWIVKVINSAKKNGIVLPEQ